MTSVGGNLWRDSAEARKLKSCVRNITEANEPDDDYRLKIWARGIAPRQNVVDTVSGWFNLELDPTIGSRLEMSRDRLTGALILHRLAMPLKQSPDQHGAIYIQGMEPDDNSEYIGYAKLFNDHKHSVSWGPEETDNLSRLLLEGHDIPLMPNRDSANYRAWLGMHVLGKAKGWEMMEKIQIARDGDSTLAIVRDQCMPEDIRDRADTLSIIQTTVNRDIEEKPIIQRTLSFHDNRGTSNIVRVTSLWKRNSSGRLVSSDRYKNVSESDISYFSELLESASDSV